MKKVDREIERIMSDAFDKAASVLEREIRRFLKASRGRYSRFVLAVGWGPSLFAADGSLVKDWQLKGRARETIDLANRFYDRYGADNRQIKA